MSHNPMTNLLKKAFSDSLKDNKEISKSFYQSRRKFLRDSVYAAGSLALMPSFFQASIISKKNKQDYHIAIIGAGMAGLNTCYQLKKQGIHATVYEASVRAGGRMFTLKNEFGKGLTTDIGGEFVDTTHTEILQLMKELSLPMYDLREDKLIPKELFFDGAHLSNEDLKNALSPFVKQLMSDIKSLPEKITHETADSFRRFDNLSITEYISGIGISGWLHDFINVVLTREYGMEASEQSAINFLIMFTPPADAYYEMFGEDHEVFKIKGGSQHLTDVLYQQLKDRVVLKHKLVEITPDTTGGYHLSFENDKKQTGLHADYVVMAIPFTILRKIKFDVPMPDEKRKCIDEMGYGNSCKFVMGFNGKAWRNVGKQGYTFTDISFGCGWDSAQSQSEKKGSFTVFSGGDFGDYVFNKTKDELISDFIPGLEKIYPGAEKLYSGKNVKFCWEKNPFSQAGYSSFRKGQWASLAGWESVPVGNIYFAGEHVSRDYQGYMNGAAQTARMAATAIAEKISKAKSSAVSKAHSS